MTAATKHSRRTVLAGMAAGGALATTVTAAIAAAPTPDSLLAMDTGDLESIRACVTMIDARIDAMEEDLKALGGEVQAWKAGVA